MSARYLLTSNLSISFRVEERPSTWIGLNGLGEQEEEDDDDDDCIAVQGMNLNSRAIFNFLPRDRRYRLPRG